MKMKDSVINKQAARISELEADRKVLGDLLLRSDAQLVALRRKIDEAPVVAWIAKDGCLLSEDDRETNVATLAREGWSPLTNRGDLL